MAPITRSKPTQNGVGKIQVAVFENINLDSLQDLNSFARLVKGVDLIDLLQQAVGSQAMRNGKMARVVRYPNIAQTLLFGGASELLDRIGAVCFAAMNVQIALDVFKLYQPRQFAARSRL